MINKLKLFAGVLLTLTIGFSACSSNDDNNEVLSSEKQMLSFKVGTTTGVIDEVAKTVALVLPSKSNIKEVVPTEIKISPDAIVTPKQGEKVDLSSVTDYTVTAQDGSKQIYKVSATVAKSTDASIISFSFDGLDPVVKAVITEDNKKIKAEVPFGTDLKTLVPTITIVGSKVSPESGKAQDFSKPVIYKVTAEDENVFVEYELTITVAKFDLKIESAEYDVDTKSVIVEGQFPADNSLVKAYLVGADKKEVEISILKGSEATVGSLVFDLKDFAEGTYQVRLKVGDVTKDSKDIVIKAKEVDFDLKIESAEYDADAKLVTVKGQFPADNSSVKAYLVGADGKEVELKNSATVAPSETAIVFDAKDVAEGTYKVRIKVGKVTKDSADFEVKAKDEPTPGFDFQLNSVTYAEETVLGIPMKVLMVSGNFPLDMTTLKAVLIDSKGVSKSIDDGLDYDDEENPIEQIGYILGNIENGEYTLRMTVGSVSKELPITIGKDAPTPEPEPNPSIEYVVTESNYDAASGLLTLKGQIPEQGNISMVLYDATGNKHMFSDFMTVSSATETTLVVRFGGLPLSVGDYTLEIIVKGTDQIVSAPFEVK